MLKSTKSKIPDNMDMISISRKSCCIVWEENLDKNSGHKVPCFCRSPENLEPWTRMVFCEDTHRTRLFQTKGTKLAKTII